MILSGSLSNLRGTLEETKCLMLNLGASDEVDKWLWLRLAAILSYPGARLALQVGTVCTGWGEAAKLGRRQERLKRGKWLFLSRNPHSFAKLKFSSLLAALLFPLSLFHYSGSSAFTLSTKGLSLLHSISALCHPFPPPRPRGSLWRFCNRAFQTDRRTGEPANKFARWQQLCKRSNRVYVRCGFYLLSLGLILSNNNRRGKG